MLNLELIFEGDKENELENWASSCGVAWKETQKWQFDLLQRAIQLREREAGFCWSPLHSWSSYLHTIIWAKLRIFKSSHCHLLARGSWVNYLTSLCFCFLICKTGLVIVAIFTELLWMLTELIQVKLQEQCLAPS